MGTHAAGFQHAAIVAWDDFAANTRPPHAAKATAAEDGQIGVELLGELDDPGRRVP